MKLIVLLTVIAFTYGAKLDRTYLPPDAHSAGGSNAILQAPVSETVVVTESPIYQRPNVAQVVTEVPAFQRPVITTEVPVYQRPIAKEVVTEIPIFQRPVTENVVTEIPTYQGPVPANVVTAYRRPLATYYVAEGPAYQRPVSGNVILENPALQRPITGNIIEAEHQPENGVVAIGNQGNVYVQRPTIVGHKDVIYPGPQLQVIEQRPERTQANLERHAAVLRQEYKNDGDSYAYAYETENGINGEENGVATHGTQAHGAYSYVGDDGVQYTIKYTADENGFQPHGDHLPTPPPIPEEILRSLEQNAREEAAGIYDDGSYSEEKYGEAPLNKEELGIINVVDNRPNIVSVPVINEHAENEDTVIIPNPALSSRFQRPIYRHPGILIDQVNGLRPIVGQEVIQNVNKAYLPPLDQKVLEDRSSQNIVKPVFGTKLRQPSFNTKSGYQY